MTSSRIRRVRKGVSGALLPELRLKGVKELTKCRGDKAGRGKVLFTKVLVVERRRLSLSSWRIKREKEEKMRLGRQVIPGKIMRAMLGIFSLSTKSSGISFPQKA